MYLKEFEGKSILEKHSIKIPKYKVINRESTDSNFILPGVLKSQVLSGSRKAKGGIKFITNEQEAKESLQQLLSIKINDELPTEILNEEIIQFTNEYYVSFMFDSRIRGILLVISDKGGSDIENVNQNQIKKIEINILKGIDKKVEEKMFKFLPNEIVQTIKKLYKVFREEDLKLLEINPLVLTINSKVYALDSKISLDENALYRHQFSFEERTGLKVKTESEKLANLIDKNDHKGVAGKTYVELDGDIGILASGGGASMVAMDALLEYGAKPANYTEYSGNPPSEKVKKLTRIVLNNPNLTALWIVGGKANFTRVDITLNAILEILIEKKVKFPIIVRRAGPNSEIAFENMKRASVEHNLNIHLFDDSTPISVSAKYVKNLSEKYKNE